MSGWDEEIAHGGKDGDEMLKGANAAEALPHSLPLSKRQVRVLRSVVEPLCDRCSTSGMT